MNHLPQGRDNFSSAISISFFEVCKNTYEQHSVHYTCVINTRGKLTTRVNETVKHFTDNVNDIGVHIFHIDRDNTGGKFSNEYICENAKRFGRGGGRVRNIHTSLDTPFFQVTQKKCFVFKSDT
jgi:hypothetical protein